MNLSIEDLNFIKGKLSFWRDNPHLFVREVFKATPEVWQEDVLRAIVTENRISIRSGHGVGKSCLASWIIFWYLATRTPAKILATAPTSHQLYDILWSELSIWKRKAEYKFGELFDIPKASIHLVGAEKENFGSARTARKDQPEALQGAHSENMMFIIDESSGIPSIIFETAEGSLSTLGAKVIMFSNPTRTSGYFYDSFHKNRAQWWTKKVSCFESTKVSPSYITEMAATYGIESNVYRVRVLGEFPNSSDDAVISLKDLEDSVGRGIEGFGPIVWGIDIARYGSNRSALSKRQGPKLLEKTKWWAAKDLMQTSGIIFKEWEETPIEKRPERIIIDVVGLGAGVADRLKELGLPIVGLNVCEAPSESLKYARLRDELWFAAREFFENKTSDIFDDDALISELSGPTYKILSSGKIQVESKDEMKDRGLNSPDLGDSFVMTFAKNRLRGIKKPVVNYNRPASWASR